ncbi:hypothetical protein J3F84DRAFT_372754 [Trichoderma pleuroticola]
MLDMTGEPVPVAALHNWKFYATMPISPADLELTMVCHVYDNWAVGNVETAWDDAGPWLFSTASRPCLGGSNSNTAAL